MQTVKDYFGSLVFDDRVMKSMLPADVYASLRKTIDEEKKLAPGVAAKMTELLNSPKVPAIAKVRILEIILERTYGKPETALKLTTAQQSVEAAQARISAIVSQIRIGDVNE